MRLHFLETRPDRRHDELGFVLTALLRVRRQWSPFLWRDENWSRQTMYETALGTAAIVLLSDEYDTQRQLYNAIQRALYAEARAWGFRRQRASAHYTEDYLPAGAIGS